MLHNTLHCVHRCTGVQVYVCIGTGVYMHRNVCVGVCIGTGVYTHRNVYVGVCIGRGVYTHRNVCVGVCIGQEYVQVYTWHLCDVSE